ncbi:hypothetical protein PZ897_14555 [Hoeflea sp. YIM 152468]|uniref:hypothetical protein n=1 Tax=Hoeflea sp. YIM 152468 TaxID=3031759 RepID=UPI0023DB7508|nr:hypothetical protein [Hoeflea sp. YIM 152468]MDF1609403.1 hypothetical protein [Hoeflea sp. YIM 152468]
MKTWLSMRWFVPLCAAGLLAACGEEPEDAPDTLLPDRPEDKLIEDTRQPERVDQDPTPQTGTSGVIPGYNPVEGNDDGEAEPSVSD